MEEPGQSARAAATVFTKVYAELEQVRKDLAETERSLELRAQERRLAEEEAERLTAEVDRLREELNNERDAVSLWIKQWKAADQSLQEAERLRAELSLAQREADAVTSEEPHLKRATATETLIAWIEFLQGRLHGSRVEVERLRAAVKEAEALLENVGLAFEPASNSTDYYSTWIASRDGWLAEHGQEEPPAGEPA